MDELKLCKDCKHFVRETRDYDYGSCQRKTTTETNLISGTHTYAIELNAEYERDGVRQYKGFWEELKYAITGKKWYPDPSKCGREGKFFQPKRTNITVISNGVEKDETV